MLVSSPFRYGLLTALLTTASTLAAQQPAYNPTLTEPDQELDGFSGKFASIHRVTSRLRGVRGLDETLYWVSADGRQLTAYQKGRQLWQADVSRAFAKLLPGARVDHLVLSSGLVFLFTTGRGHAEISRATGSISALGADPN